MFRVNGVRDDAIRLRLFSFSLKDKAREWFNCLPARSITNWAILAQKFFAKYFPPGKTVKLRNDITNFMQYDQESMYEAISLLMSKSGPNKRYPIRTWKLP